MDAISRPSPDASRSPASGLRLPKAVLYDLDGTLVHSAPGLAIAIGHLLEESGLPRLSEDRVIGMVGNGAAMLVARAFAAHGVGNADGTDPGNAERLERFLEIYEADPITGATPYHGVAEVLSDLAAAGVAQGCATNKPERPAQAMLDALGLMPWLGSLVGGDTLPTRKPDPAPLLAACAALGAAPAETVMVGDSISDVQAARAAGMPVVVVSWGYTDIAARELGGDVVIDRFTDLPEALETATERFATNLS